MKLLKSNWREILALLFVVSVLFFALLLLGSADVSANGPLSTLVSLVTSLIGGVAKFAVALALAWFGLAVTFPEANRFVVGQGFDIWWTHLTNTDKGRVSVIAAGVLSIVAALCMAS